MITLKNIQYAAFASEETNCYTATLYVEGVKWGEVGNDGHGGADWVHLAAGRSYDDLKALNARIAEAYPPLDLELDDGRTIPADLETVCGDLVSAHLEAKSLASLMRTKALFFKATPQDGAPLYQLALKGRPLDAAIAHLNRTYPGVVILNTMPKDEALRLYRLAA